MQMTTLMFYSHDMIMIIANGYDTSNQEWGDLRQHSTSPKINSIQLCYDESLDNVGLIKTTQSVL